MALAMGRPVAELLDTMSGAEFDLWARYAARFPFGPKQDDRRAGTIAQAMCGAKPADLFPSLRPPPSVRSFRLWAGGSAPAARSD